MMRFKAASSRGIISSGAVLSHHTFSFGTYIDLEGMCFHQLKVLSFEVFPPHSFLNLDAKSDYCLYFIQVQGRVEYRDKEIKLTLDSDNRLVRVDKSLGSCYTLSNDSDEVAEIYQLWIKGNCDQIDEVEVCSINKGESQKKKCLNKKIWIQCLKGELNVGNFKLTPGDGLAIENENDFEITAKTEGEFILIQVPTF